jgi:uncharacterized membrane protein YdjX (TVP38/TMEM64 family)
MAIDWRRLWIAIAVIVCAAAIATILVRTGLHPRAVAEWLTMAGDRWWAPLVFIALYTLFNTLLLPATILTLTAGVVWGWWIGGLWVLAASTIGSAVPYAIGRSGAGWVGDLLKRKAGRIHDALRHEGFTTLLLMRLIPIVPYNVLNYAAGLAGIRVRDYLVATFAGTIPGIFIFTALASGIAAGLVTPRQAFVRILIAGALLATLVLITRMFAGKVRSRIGE